MNESGSSLLELILAILILSAAFLWAHTIRLQLYRQVQCTRGVLEIFHHTVDESLFEVAVSCRLKPTSSH